MLKRFTAEEIQRTKPKYVRIQDLAANVLLVSLILIPTIVYLDWTASGAVEVLVILNCLGYASCLWWDIKTGHSSKLFLNYRYSPLRKFEAISRELHPVLFWTVTVIQIIVLLLILFLASNSFYRKIHWWPLH